MKKTFATAAALAAVFALQGSGPALAQQSPPTGVDGTPFVIPANSSFYACDFNLQIAYQGKGGTLKLPGGRFMSIAISPGMRATLTNLQNNNAVTLNITGTGKQSLDAWGNFTYAENGRNLLGDPTTGLVLVVGDFSFTLDAAGNLVKPLSGVGRMLPVCPMLQ